jgi:hypothetical protein
MHSNNALPSFLGNDSLFIHCQKPCYVLGIGCPQVLRFKELHHTLCKLTHKHQGCDLPSAKVLIMSVINKIPYAITHIADDTFWKALNPGWPAVFRSWVKYLPLVLHSITNAHKDLPNHLHASIKDMCMVVSILCEESCMSMKWPSTLFRKC